jgi:hypothetical protein
MDLKEEITNYKTFIFPMVLEPKIVFPQNSESEKTSNFFINYKYVKT